MQDEETTSGTRTVGHSARHPGLQGESIGDIYPLAVVGVGNYHWIVQHLITGEEWGRGERLKCKEAHARAIVIKSNYHI